MKLCLDIEVKDGQVKYWKLQKVYGKQNFIAWMTPIKAIDPLFQKALGDILFAVEQRSVLK